MYPDVSTPAMPPSAPAPEYAGDDDSTPLTFRFCSRASSALPTMPPICAPDPPRRSTVALTSDEVAIDDLAGDAANLRVDAALYRGVHLHSLHVGRHVAAYQSAERCGREVPDLTLVARVLDRAAQVASALVLADQAADGGAAVAIHGAPSFHVRQHAVDVDANQPAHLAFDTGRRYRDGAGGVADVAGSVGARPVQRIQADQPSHAGIGILHRDRAAAARRAVRRQGCGRPGRRRRCRSPGCHNFHRRCTRAPRCC